jgi:GH15 family glucan-1,4-alpha-glucosidase
MDALYLSRLHHVHAEDDAWAVQRRLLDWLEGHWREPDEGMWEVRGGRQQFTSSKVQAWVAFDRAVTSVERMRLPGPVDRWRVLREHIHREVCERGFDRTRNTFTQIYGGRPLDASLLLVPIVGFLPGDDPRVIGTIDAIQRELMVDGLVRRYPVGERGQIDGVPGGEGVFLACSFWLCDALVLIGRRDEARALFERLLALRNDVGLLAEEYDPQARRQLGNFPQAFSHVALINSARNLSQDRGPAHVRAGQDGER